MKREGSSITLVTLFIKHFDSVWNTCSHTHVLEWQRTLIAKVQARAQAPSKSNFQCIENKNAMHKNTCKISSWGMVIKNPNESWIGVTSNACFKTQSQCFKSDRYA
jgi:hypothetical protein